MVHCLFDSDETWTGTCRLEALLQCNVLNTAWSGGDNCEIWQKDQKIAWFDEESSADSLRPLSSTNFLIHVLWVQYGTTIAVGMEIESSCSVFEEVSAETLVEWIKESRMISRFRDHRRNRSKIITMSDGQICTVSLRCLKLLRVSRASISIGSYTRLFWVWASSMWRKRVSQEVIKHLILYLK